MNGQFTTLHNFAGPDGAYVSNLVLGDDGDLYGTTGDGGPAGTGTFFKITPGGALVTLQDLSPIRHPGSVEASATNPVIETLSSTMPLG
jgi:uncharacterized repeat protein (TIGR03803 family)